MKRPLAVASACISGMAGLMVNAPADAFSAGAGTCTVGDPAIAASAHLGISAGADGYSIALPADYLPGKPLTVTLSGAVSFKGLLIYAVDDAANRVGAWTVPAGYQIKACGGEAQSTMTQSGSTSKAAPANFTWTAPAALTGNVTFKALVMVSLNSYFDISGATISEAIFRNGFD